MTLILHEHPLSPYAQKIRIMLREKGLAFEARVPEGLGSGADPTNYAQANPRVEVPALVHDDVVIYDSTIILEYIEETWPEPAMLPRAPAERARQRIIEDVFDTHWEAINWGLGEIRFFKRGGDTLGPVMRKASEEQIAHLYTWLGNQLGSRPWLAGDSFGWADIAAVPYVTMTALMGLAPPVGSTVADWYARVRARPSVVSTEAEAMAVIPAMDTLLPLLESGAFRRHVRDHRLEWMIRSGGLQVVADGIAANNIRFTDFARFAAP